MSRLKRFGRWPRDHKIAFWSLVSATVVGIAAIVVPLAVASSSGSSPRSTQDNNGGSGNVNISGGSHNKYVIGGTYIASGSPTLSGPRIPANSCPVGQRDMGAIDMLVRLYANGGCFSRSLVVGQTPSKIQFEIIYTNTSRAVERNVEFRAVLDDGLEVVSGTTYLLNTIYPKGLDLDTDAVAGNGIVADSYYPQSRAYISFEVTTPALRVLRCGSNVLRATAYIQPEGKAYRSAVATISLYRDCPKSTTG